MVGVHETIVNSEEFGFPCANLINLTHPQRAMATGNFHCGNFS